MSASAFVVVQAALVTALQSAPALSGVPVYANRTRALPRNDLKAVLLRLDSTRDDAGPHGVRDWATTFEIEPIARAQSGTDPVEAVDPLLQACWCSLDGLMLVGVMEVAAEPQIEWNFDSADTPLASAVMRITVRHRTDGNTLTPKD